jgi:hypothetical protein
MLVIPLFYESLILIQSSGIGTIVGATSKRAFLDANVTGFRAFETAPLTEIEGRVLLLGDGRDYYCSPMCIPDPDHFRWASDVEGLTTCTAVRDWMRNLNVRAIMLNLEDIDFLLQHDPVGAMSTAIQRIQSLNAAGCLQLVYEENLIRVYSLAE